MPVFRAMKNGGFGDEHCPQENPSFLCLTNIFSCKIVPDYNIVPITLYLILQKAQVAG